MTACAQPGCTSPVRTRGYCERHYRYRLHTGRHGYRDATKVREHIARLRELGWTWGQIGAAAGMSHAIPYNLMAGRRYRRVLVDTHDSLLSVPAVPVASHRGVDSAGTRRRVQALSWMGWPCHEVARRAGTTEYTLRTLILPHRRPSYALARRVAAVYDELSHRPGPSSVAAGRARAVGFAPPAAWDDDTIDDPMACPHPASEGEWVDEVAIERALARQPIGRQLTDDECRHIADLLVSQGKGSHAICRALRCNGSTARLLYEDATARLRAAERAEGVPAA